MYTLMVSSPAAAASLGSSAAKATAANRATKANTLKPFILDFNYGATVSRISFKPHTRRTG